MHFTPTAAVEGHAIHRSSPSSVPVSPHGRRFLATLYEYLPIIFCISFCPIQNRNRFLTFRNFIAYLKRTPLIPQLFKIYANRKDTHLVLKSMGIFAFVLKIIFDILRMKNIIGGMFRNVLSNMTFKPMGQAGRVTIITRRKIVEVILLNSVD